MARKLAVIMHAMWSDGTLYMRRPGAHAKRIFRRAPAVKDRKLLGALA